LCHSFATVERRSCGTGRLATARQSTIDSRQPSPSPPAASTLCRRHRHVDTHREDRRYRSGIACMLVRLPIVLAAWSVARPWVSRCSQGLVGERVGGLRHAGGFGPQ